jgi:predicted PurR-regulated permease PerM
MVAVSAEKQHLRDGSDTVPRPMQIAVAWSWRLLVVAALVLAVLWLIGHYLVVVAPVLIALLLVALVLPVVGLLERLRVPRGVASLLTVVLVIAVVVGLATLVGTAVANGFPQLQNQAGEGLTEVRATLARPPLRLTTDQVAGYVDQIRTGLGGSRTALVSGALAATTTATHVVAGLFIALFSTYFFLAQGERIWGWVLRLLPHASHEPLDRAGRRGWGTLTSFVRATVVVASTDALGIGVGAALLGVPLALPLGVLVFLGAFVPVVGALVSGSVAVLIALVAVGPVKALLMLAVVIGIQQLESHVLQPFLLGRAVSVHPLAVIIAIAAGALTAGILGALFAVPFTAVLNTMVLSLAGHGDDEPAAPRTRRPGPVDDAGAEPA